MTQTTLTIHTDASPQPSTSESDFSLPRAPSDQEKVAYFGPQQRWVTPISFVGFALIALSIAFFVLRHLWSIAILAPLGVSALATTVSLFTSTRRRRDSLEDHRRRVDAWRPDVLPSVDVFLPSAGEDLRVLANTYANVRRLEWDGPLHVYVLDDSDRAEVAAMAAEHGFHYLVRPNRGELKKAGNLRFGFEHSSGDLIAVFDADFVPRPDFIRELAPYFDDPQTGIVQSPQFFDIDPRMSWLQRSAGATQVLFYKWVQPSRDRSDAAICVGTSALYRRAGLNKSGGFARIGHSEDVHTGVNLMKVGYGVRYVPILVSKGICPDNIAQFMTQQYRWCTGSMSLLFSKSFHSAPFRFMQRLSYWSGFLYYISTALNVFVAILPSVLMALFAADHVRPANYVFVALALIGRMAIVPIITMERESFLGLARVQTVYSFSHAIALFDVLRRRTDSWVATGSAQRSPTAKRVRRLSRIWLVLVQSLLWGAMAFRIPEYGIGRYWPMVVFALLNAWVMLPVVWNGPAPRRLWQWLRLKFSADPAVIDLRELS